MSPICLVWLSPIRQKGTKVRSVASMSSPRNRTRSQTRWRKPTTYLQSETTLGNLAGKRTTLGGHFQNRLFPSKIRLTNKFSSLTCFPQILLPAKISLPFPPSPSRGIVWPRQRKNFPLWEWRRSSFPFPLPSAPPTNAFLQKTKYKREFPKELKFYL